MKLGDTAKDKISGYTGIITGRAEYLYSNPQIRIGAQSLHNGAPVVSQWFDEDSVQVIKENKEMGFKQRKEADI